METERPPHTKPRENSFDDQNRLTQVKVDGKLVEYRYNGDGLLTDRIQDGVHTRYYYDGNSAQIIAEATIENGKPVLKANYIRGLKLEAIAYADQTEAYPVYNGHGDIIEIRDSSGALLNQYQYDIWGNEEVKEEKVHNPFRYSGELWDDTTELQYLRARWYDPDSGRFINEDTYEGEQDNPSSLNLYTYVQNNPLGFVDPSGHMYTEIGTNYSANDSASINKYKAIFQLGVVHRNPLIMQSAHDAANFVRLKYQTYVNRTNYLSKVYYPIVNKDQYNELLKGSANEVPFLEDPLFFLFDGTFTLSYKAAASLAVKTLGKKSVEQTTTYMLKMDLQLFAKKGKEFRGGAKSTRDNWYGYNDKEFQKWWHRSGKKEYGGNDIEDSAEAKAIYEYWTSIGKPNVK